jgi:hypothetical protein
MCDPCPSRHPGEGARLTGRDGTALEIADRAILLLGDGRNEDGAAADVITVEKRSALFAMPMKTLPKGESVHIVADFGAIVRV